MRVVTHLQVKIYLLVFNYDDNDCLISIGSYKAVVYAVPLAVLIVTLLTIIVILILVLRSRKRRRDRRIITHLHSPSLKEAAFFKEEGLHSPVSPGNSSFGDHLEFPRNRLYIYSNKVLGM